MSTLDIARWSRFPSERQARLRDRHWVLTDEELALFTALHSATGRCIEVATGPVGDRVAFPGNDGLGHLALGRQLVKPRAHTVDGKRRRARIDRENPCPAHIVPPGLRARPELDWPAFVPRIRDPPDTWPTSTPPKEYVWAVLYSLQGGHCAYCRHLAPHYVDHDHDTHLVRGLLCRHCNNVEPRCFHDIDCFSDYRDAPPAKPFGWRHWRWSETARRRRTRDVTASRHARGLPSIEVGFDPLALRRAWWWLRWPE